MSDPLTPSQCAHALRALADPTRLRILAALQGGPLSVGQVCDALGLRQYQASRHLGALAELGLLVPTRDGRRVFYALAPDVILDDAAATVEFGCCRISVAPPAGQPTDAPAKRA